MVPFPILGAFRIGCEQQPVLTSSQACLIGAPAFHSLPRVLSEKRRGACLDHCCELLLLAGVLGVGR